MQAKAGEVNMWRCIFATLILNKILIFSSLSGEIKAYVTPDDCRILTEHIPGNDVTYKAGVDMRGKSVKGANLSPSPNLGIKNKLSFLLILDIAKENRVQEGGVDQFTGHPGLKGEISLGRIIIQDGKVTLDGKPLVASHQQALAEFCQKSKNLP